MRVAMVSWISKTSASFAVESIRPDSAAVSHVHHLRRHTQTLAGRTHAAFEDMTYAQGRGDLAEVGARRARVKRGRARGDPQAIDTRQRGDNLLGHTVAEVRLNRAADSCR
jgi:hypothetical protein